MTSKLHQLNELANVLSDKEKTHEGVLAFYHQFKVSRLLNPFNAIKSKGYLVSTLILALIMYRIQGASVWAMQKTGNLALFLGDENTIYRLMNNPLMSWCKLLMSFAKQFVVKAETHGAENTNTKCFIIDGQIADTTIVLITHTILTLQRRFEAYETMGDLFRESQQQLLELTLWERILKIFIKMLRELLEILSIDIEETIEKIMTCDKSASQLWPCSMLSTKAAIMPRIIPKLLPNP